MNNAGRRVIPTLIVISIFCGCLFGCSDKKSTEIKSSIASSDYPSSSTSSETVSTMSDTSSDQGGSSATLSSGKSTSSKASIAQTSSSAQAIKTSSSSKSPTIVSGIKIDNIYNTCYGAKNQMQYDVISAGAQEAIANYKSEIERFKSCWTAESFKERYHVNINDELALKTIIAMNHVMMLGGKDCGSDGFNAYVVFAGIGGNEANWRSSHRAMEAICHKLGVNCKVADYPKENATWLYVQLGDGKWYHFGISFDADPEQYIKGGSACTIFY